VSHDAPSWREYLIVGHRPQAFKQGFGLSAVGALFSKSMKIP
jgi:hypothetical protein